MSIDLKIDNLGSFNKKLNAHLKNNLVKQYITRGTILVMNTAKKSIMSGGSGIEYSKYQPRRTHRASAAGQPPANDTGFLVSQITMTVKSKSNGSVEGSIISAAPYSKALEFGTTNMMARPFMHPALKKNERKIKAMFKKGILK
tara:strand:+ start:834 stop:1265 length:432 start_codon:yes stop_codon:yes gene_type:complete